MKLLTEEDKQQFLKDYETMTTKSIQQKYKISSKSIYQWLRELNPDFPSNKFKHRKPRTIKYNEKKYRVSESVIETAHTYIINSKSGVNLNDYY